ncbi:MAG: polysaccharide biosynthesis protein [Bacillota bacterium]|nr:polysaccharide biosynthesis protein [Bacillota bacterium]
MREDSFLRGVLVLTLAGLAARALGAVYRVFLYPLLGPEGIGLFQMAYPVYSTLLVLSTSGANVALSRMVSARLGAGKSAEVGVVFRAVLGVLAVVGVALGAALFAASPWLAGAVYREPRAAPALQAVAPAVLAVVMMSAYRGLFQGYQKMHPPAVSQIVEQVVRVGTMFLLAWLLLPAGVAPAAAGAAFGATTGGAAGLVYLAWCARARPGDDAAERGARRGGPPRGGDFLPVMREFLGQAVPVSMTGAMFTVFTLADVVVPARLQAAGFSPEAATAWYGRLTGGAMPLVNLPSLFSASLQLALVPAVARCLAAGDREGAADRAATGLRFTVTLTAAAAVGLAVLAEPICATLYGDPKVAVALRPLAGAALFLGLQQATAGILQGLGEVAVPLWHLGVAAVLKVVMTWYVAGQPSGVVGVAWATVAGFGLAGLLGIAAVARRLGRVASVSDLVLRPGAALAVMGLCLPALYRWGQGATGSPWGGIGLGVVAGACLYLVALLVVGGFRESDLEMLPARARFLEAWLRRSGLLRP